MQRTQTYLIEVGEDILPFRFSLMSCMHYFELTEREITTIKKQEDAIIYFYCAYKSGCEYTKEECQYSLSEWMNLIDDYPEAVNEITKQFESTLKKK